MLIFVTTIISSSSIVLPAIKYFDSRVPSSHWRSKTSPFNKACSTSKIERSSLLISSSPWIVMT
ncbi:MAG: hypothetical protein IPM50_13920 [Acidobacteriota bacterium]|nr:MAG: hypothetical protein IPM50_13920 [Acidobacteriota bacterium]